MYTSNSTTLRPEAYITVKKNRLKLYDGKNHYLKNKTNFEIELFNPTRENVLAKIWVNDKLISPSGLIVKAGHRSYLERFIDVAEKFQFNTFEVDNVRETSTARATNGLIKVCFFKEILKPAPVVINEYNYPHNHDYFYPKYGTGYFTGGNGLTSTMLNLTSDSNSKSVSSGLLATGVITTPGDSSTLIGGTTTGNTSNAFYCNTMNTGHNPAMTLTSTSTISNATLTVSNCIPDTIETGRIAAGPKSGQSFTTAYGEYVDTSYETYIYQLLPESLKAAVDVNTIRTYCECGTRIKKTSWNHCPECGSKL